MKLLVRIVILIAVGVGAYLFFVPNASLSDLTNYLPSGLKEAQASVTAAIAPASAEAATTEAPATASAPATAPAPVTSVAASPSTPPAPVAAPATQASSLPPAAPIAAKPQSTPRPPETIRLKNGKSIVGNIIIRDPEVTMIRTADGKTTEVRTKDIVATP